MRLPDQEFFRSPRLTPGNRWPRPLAEKIFSNHCGRRVRAGEFILADLDLLMAHDTTCAWALEPFYQIAERVFDPQKNLHSL